LSFWPSSKAKRVRKALGRIGWKDDPNDTQGKFHQKLIQPTLTITRGRLMTLKR
jgi:hypothetical protein